MLNQQIGPYKIISKLGEGGMANVYLAKKGTLGKKVALKVLKEDFISNRHVRGRFLSEARKMISLNHSNIVGVQDLIDDPDFVAIELEYIEGKTLKQHLQDKGALPDDEIENLLKQMIDAIGYVHEKGFVHRDIKPSNFMLTQSGVIKLTDFGIAKNVDDSNMDYTGTGTGMQMGTPKYMSPEQVRSTKDVDHRSDIYSLGVVLWEMVTGRVPYDIATESTFDVFRKIVDESLTNTNTKWDEVIKKATSKEVNERYNIVSDIELKRRGLKELELKNSNKTIKYVIVGVLLLVIVVIASLAINYSYFGKREIVNLNTESIQNIDSVSIEKQLTDSTSIQVKEKPIEFKVESFKFDEMIQFFNYDDFGHGNQTTFYLDEKKADKREFLCIANWELNSLTIKIDDEYVSLPVIGKYEFKNEEYHVKFKLPGEILVHVDPVVLYKLTGKIYIENSTGFKVEYDVMAYQ